jgi:hypothetical protein
MAHLAVAVNESLASEAISTAECVCTLDALVEESVAASDEVGGIRRTIRFLPSPSSPAMGR